MTEVVVEASDDHSGLVLLEVRVTPDGQPVQETSSEDGSIVLELVPGDSLVEATAHNGAGLTETVERLVHIPDPIGPDAGAPDAPDAEAPDAGGADMERVSPPPRRRSQGGCSIAW